MTTTTDLTVPEGALAPEQLTTQAQTFAAIETAEQAQEAGFFLRNVSTAIRKWRALFKDARKPFRDELAKIEAQEDQTLAPYLEAERLIKARVTAWQVAENERVAREAREQLEAARKEEETKRQKQVEELRNAAAVKTGTERRIINAQAKALEQAPITPTITTRQPEATKIRGVSLKTTYVGRVDDFAALFAAIVQGRVPLSAMMPNQKVIDDMAKQMGEELRWPGVTVVKEHNTSARSL